MSLVGWVSLLAFVALLVALLGLWRGRERVLSRDAGWLLAVLLALLLLHAVSNLLEWAGITARLDSLEDYAEILIPVVWGSFFYVCFREMVQQQLQDTVAALDRARILYRTLAEHSPVGIWQTEPDGSGGYINPKLVEITGLTPERAQDMGWASALHPDDRERVSQAWSAFLQDQAPYHTTCRFQHPDGTIRWVVGQAAPTRSADGQLLGFVGTLTDITDLKQAEEALEEREARLRDLYENAPHAYFSVGVDGHIVRCNRHAAELLGYAVEELVGRPVLDLYADAPQGKGRARQILERFRAGESVEGEELLMQKADGTPLWISLTVNVVRDAQGRVVESRSAVVDISERKQAEAAQRRYTQQLEALQRVGLELATELDLDRLLRFIAERAVELLQGTSGGIYLYRPAEDVLEWSVAVGPGMPPPGSRLRRGEGVSGMAWEQGRPVIVDDYAAWSGPKAPIYQGYQWKAVLAVPVQWGQELLGVLDVLADRPAAFSESDARLLEIFANQAAVAIHNARLFEQERRQRELAEALAQAATALSSLNLDEVLDQILEQVDRVIPCDAANIMRIDGDVAHIVRWRGYARRGSEDYVAGVAFRISEVRDLREMVRTGQPIVIPDTRTYEDWIHIPEQSWLLSYAGVPIRVGEEVVGFLSVDSETPGHFGLDDAEKLKAFAGQAAAALTNARLFQELQLRADELEARVAERTAALQERISASEQLNRAMTNLLEDLQRANQRAVASARRLEQLNAELEAFAYSVSHDLRAPLRAISGFSHILAQRHRAGLDEDGRHYLNNIIQASDQMDRLIDDLLKYSRLGRRAVRRQPLSLASILCQVVGALRPRIEETGASVHLADDLPTVLGDRTLLEQIFLNLIDNALTYRREGVAPRIEVFWRLENGSVVVSVRDNGIGIAEEYHQKIFNVFQRLHSAEDYPGTGIGLALVKKATDLLGGEIGVQSVVGEGSTFWVRLPAVE